MNDDKNSKVGVQTTRSNLPENFVNTWGFAESDADLLAENLPMHISHIVISDIVRKKINIRLSLCRNGSHWRGLIQ